MTEGLAGSSRSKRDALAIAINRHLTELLLLCERGEGVHHYFDVAVIAYTTDRKGKPVIGPALQGRLAGRELVSTIELSNFPLRVDEVVKKVDDGAGGLIDVMVRIAVWYEPPADGEMAGGPMCAALGYVTNIARQWCAAHEKSFPPIVIHVTDGESTDGDPEAAAAALRALRTQDGEVLLFNCYLSNRPGAGVLFPVSEAELPSDGYAHMLFRMSSVLPESVRHSAEARQIVSPSGARGMSFNADSRAMLMLIQTGTAPRLTEDDVEFGRLEEFTTDVIEGGTAVREPELLQLEDVQFTVYRPKAVRPGVWYRMLAFVHLADRRSDAPADEADPIEQVRTEAARILTTCPNEYRDTSADASQSIPRESEITLVPYVPGIEFNPERRTFRWMKDVHREEFDLRASSTLNGTRARGRLSAYLGTILIAEVNLAIKVNANHREVSKAETVHRETVRPYRRIFASYSHKDVEIVRQYELFVETMGDRYLRDVRDLRSGEEWDSGLLKLIEKADVFQLFWSTNSMMSPFVRREWEHALGLNRSFFVRPRYWEEPFPEAAAQDLPPEVLKRLHFHRIPFTGTGSSMQRTKTFPSFEDDKKSAPPLLVPPAKAAPPLTAPPAKAPPPQSSPAAKPPPRPVPPTMSAPLPRSVPSTQSAPTLPYMAPEARTVGPQPPAYSRSARRLLLILMIIIGALLIAGLGLLYSWFVSAQ
jgi:TIR domain